MKDAKGRNKDLIEMRLHKSLETITFLIEIGNEELWPIFEKLEEELLRNLQRQKKLSRYLTHNQN